MFLESQAQTGTCSPSAPLFLHHFSKKPADDSSICQSQSSDSAFHHKPPDSKKEHVLYVKYLPQMWCQLQVQCDLKMFWSWKWKWNLIWCCSQWAHSCNIKGLIQILWALKCTNNNYLLYIKSVKYMCSGNLSIILPPEGI